MIQIGLSPEADKAASSKQVFVACPYDGRRIRQGDGLLVCGKCTAILP